MDANKIDPCGCAGIFTATNTMACLAQVFDDENALDQLEKFTSLNGPKHYGLDVNREIMVLEKNEQPTKFAETIPTPDGQVTVFDPMIPVYWDVKDQS